MRARTIFHEAFWCAVLLWLSYGCASPQPVPTPQPDPAIYQAACDQLATIGCPEGAMPNCAAVLQSAQEAHLTNLRPTCLAAAQSQDAARACGTRCR